MELDDSCVVADFFDGVERDELAVHVVAEFFESFCNLDGVYRAENSTGRRGLGTDGELNVLKSGCCGFGFSLDACELVGALTLVFSKNFKS